MDDVIATNTRLSGRDERQDALCVEGAIPLLGATLSGNKADKKANNTELTRVASLMKKHKLDPPTVRYVGLRVPAPRHRFDRLAPAEPDTRESEAQPQTATAKEAS